METVAESREFVLIYKPAGIAVSTREITAPDLVHILTGQYGEVFVINRLDQPVEGLVLFAKDRKSAAFLSGAMQDGRFCKEYLAVVCGTPKEKEGTFTDYLVRNGKTNRTETAAPGTKGAKKAELDYRVLAAAEKEGRTYTLLKILLRTGRHHQIRVQTACRGIPVAGDRKYGRPEEAVRFPALCAYRLTFPDPKTGEDRTFERQPEGELFRLFEEAADIKI